MRSFHSKPVCYIKFMPLTLSSSDKFNKATVMSVRGRTLFCCCCLADKSHHMGMPLLTYITSANRICPRYPSITEVSVTL